MKKLTKKLDRAQKGKTISLDSLDTKKIPKIEGTTFDTKKIVKYQPGVLSGNERGFYLYSKDPVNGNFSPERDREFIKENEFLTVQRTPQWKEYVKSTQKNTSLVEEKNGGIIKDDKGQWAHPGKITEIGSNKITMKGVPYPVLGISDIGDKKLMKPGQDYVFKGKKVTEFPLKKKAQMGAFIGGDSPKPGKVSFSDIYENQEREFIGSTARERAAMAAQAATNSGGGKKKEKGEGLSSILGLASTAMSMYSGGKGGSGGGGSTGGMNFSSMASSFSKKNGGKIKKAQAGTNMTSASSIIPAGFTDSGMQRATGSLGQYNSNPYDRSNLDTVGQLTPAGSTNPGATGGIGGFDVSSLNIPTRQKEKGFDINKKYDKFGGPVAGIIRGFQALKAEKEQKRAAKQTAMTSDLALKASATRPEETQRRYVRPEDIQNTGEEFFPIYGVGSNPIDSAENGIHIKPENKGKFTAYKKRTGKTTSEALHSPDPHVRQMANFARNAKKWNHSGKAQTGATTAGASGGGQGASNPIYGQISGAASGMISGAYNNNAGAQFGGVAGDVVGKIPGIGPIVKLIAKPILTALGGALDPNPRKIRKFNRQTNRNMVGIAGNALGQGMQQQYTSYMENGGELSSYRAGGTMANYEPPSERAMETAAMGGELQLYDGGLKTISENPYLPNGGETVMLQGPSHEDGGMPLSYSNKMVEAEGGEPITQLEDANGERNAVIFGNLKINKEHAAMLGDDNAKNKKFKNYIKDLSEKESKSNRVNEKAMIELGGLDVITSFDKLKESSLKANVLGSNMTLKSIADKKEKAAHLQDAINTSAEEFGLDADALAQGTFKKGKKNLGAKYGANLFKAQEGYQIKGNLEGSIDYNDPEVAGGQFAGENYDKVWGVKRDAAFNNPEVTKQIISALENYTGQDANDVKAALAKQPTMSGKIQRAYELASDRKVGPYHNILDNFIDKYTPKPTPPATNIITGTPTEKTRPEFVPVEEDNTSPYINMFNEILPYFRTRDTEELDHRQLTGEMFALSSNQLEPVSAQGYRPQLDVPYDISLQEMRNENQADYRAAQRMAGYNPAMQAALNAQKYAANQKIGAEEFRLNQAKKDQVYSQNRATMNDAQMKNLGIFDQQYVRQATAKSNTKAITQAALSSIADKYAKNRLENRTLQTYENLYNYRYDKNYRTINENPLAQFDTGIKSGKQSTSRDIPDGYEYIYNKNGEPIDIKKSTKAAKESRNGSIIKSIKRI